MRIFVGTSLSVEQQNRVAQIQSELSLDDRTIDFKWIQKQKLHITWLFLDEVAAEEVTNLRARMAMAVKDFSSYHNDKFIDIKLSLEKVSLWPNADTPRVAVLEPVHVDSEFFQLAELIRCHAKGFGATTEEKLSPFRPHVTLARVCSHSGSCEQGLELDSYKISNFKIKNS